MAERVSDRTMGTDDASGAVGEGKVDTAREPAPRFRATLLGVALLWAASGIFMQSSGSSEGVEDNLVAARACMLAFLVSGAIVAAVAFFLAYRGRRLPARPVVLAAAFLYCMGVLLLIVCFNQGVFDIGRAVTCGLLVGTGDTALFLLWGRAYASLSPHKVLLHTIIAIACGIVLSQAARLIPSEMLELAVSVLLVVASLTLLHVEYGRNDDFVATFPDAWSADPGHRGCLGKTMRFIGKPLWASLVCSLIAGIVWGASSAGVSCPIAVTIVGYLVAVIGISVFAAMATASYTLAVPSDVPYGIYRCLNAIVIVVAIVLQMFLSQTELLTLCLVVTVVYIVYVFVAGSGKPRGLNA